MSKKPHKPETQAVLTRISKETFNQLREEARTAKRSMGSQVAFILEQRCLQSKEHAA